MLLFVKYTKNRGMIPGIEDEITFIVSSEFAYLAHVKFLLDDPPLRNSDMLFL